MVYLMTRVLYLVLESVTKPFPHSKPITGFVLQLAILTNHLNGKDSHIRGIAVFAPRE